MLGSAVCLICPEDLFKNDLLKAALFRSDSCDGFSCV